MKTSTSGSAFIVFLLDQVNCSTDQNDMVADPALVVYGCDCLCRCCIKRTWVATQDSRTDNGHIKSNSGQLLNYKPHHCTWCFLVFQNLDLKVFSGAHCICNRFEVQLRLTQFGSPFRTPQDARSASSCYIPPSHKVRRCQPSSGAAASFGGLKSKRCMRCNCHM